MRVLDDAPRSERIPPRLCGLAAIVLGAAVAVFTQVPHYWAQRAERLGHYPERTYVGAVPTYADDASTYWSWMRQASEGRFLMLDPFTSEPHPRNYVNVFFWLLGKVSAWTGTEIVTVYNASRLLLAGALAWLLWIFAGVFFTRAGERLACHGMLLVASGWEGVLNFLERNYGWAHVSSPQWWLPEMSTTFSMMVFPHFLGGFLCLLGIVLLMLRAWTQHREDLRRSRQAAVLAGALMVVLELFHPYDLITALGIVISAPAVFGLFDRRWPWREWRLSAVAMLVWLPSFLFSAYTFLTNPALRAWDLQNIMTTPDPLALGLSMGVGGVLAVIALANWKGMGRRHQVLLAWVLSNLLLIHLPFRFQRRMIGGLQFPIAVLAVFAIATLVLPALKKVLSRGVPTRPQRLSWGRGTLALTILLAPIQVATPWYVNDLEWTELRRVRHPSWIRASEADALRALGEEIEPDAVVFASYEMGNLVPYFTGGRCYLGHYALTIDARRKEAEVKRFFSSGPEDDPWRQELLGRCGAAFVLHGPWERELGGFDPSRVSWLVPLFSRGADPDGVVTVYRVERAASAGNSASSRPSP